MSEVIENSLLAKGLLLAAVTKADKDLARKAIKNLISA